MNAPQASPESPEPQSSTQPVTIRGPEIGPALKRDRLLQKVRSARKRLSPASSPVPRLR
ncbi:MAG TPA: hypothetical protein VFN92_08750 [Solirubrobacterales bacterium]|nr:hypothetical protein [Solirubrobacterales bacterium]